MSLLRAATALVASLSSAMLIAQTSPNSPAPARAAELGAALSGRFVPNLGQWPSPELFRATVGGLPFFLEANGWSFWLHRPERAFAAAADASPQEAGPRAADDCATARETLAVRMSFEGAQVAELVPEAPLGGVASYAFGGAGARAVSGVPSFSSVLYRSLYPGIDLRVRTSGSCFEYDLIVRPEAELSAVSVHVEGAQQLELGEAGNLLCTTALGDVEQPLPRTWAIGADGAERSLACRYELRGCDRFGFRLEARAPGETVIVDPPILYSTILGGTSDENVYGILEDGGGRVLLVGDTASPNFPTTVGVVQPNFGGGPYDGFVALLDPSLPPNQQLVFATYLGGDQDDRITEAALLASGRIGFAGHTLSANLPVTTGCYRGTYSGARDGFVGVLGADGQQIVALTYLGGDDEDFLFSVHETPTHDLLVAGRTRSQPYPPVHEPSLLHPPFQPQHRGGSLGNDGCIAILDEACTTVRYATYFGGTGDEWIRCDAISSSGVITLHGGSSSTDFPVTANAFQPLSAGGSIGVLLYSRQEIVVAQLDPAAPAGQQLVYGTYLGGSSQDWCTRVILGPTGELTLIGTTASNDFPTTPDGYQPSFAGGAVLNTSARPNFLAGDAFLLRLDPRRSGNAALLWGTYFGGAGPDQGLDAVLDPSGDLMAVGWSQSGTWSFPTTPDAMRRGYALNEGWVARWKGDGRQLLHSTLLGGLNNDGAWLLAGHAPGVVTVTGVTYSANFPVVGASAIYAGGSDLFVTRLALHAAGTTRYGVTSFHAGRYPTIHALGDAIPGNASFGIACSRAPAFGIGALWIGVQPTVLPFLCATLLVDPLSLVASVPVSADSNGEHLLPVALPPQPVSGVYLQYLWLANPLQPCLSASDGLLL
ncbi:MAG: hypothetical protein JNM84_10925 [Planctomycetes bacterium]|nr:hypothetical protein [Planctomycetota bacterium]